LRIGFRFRGTECREGTKLKDTPVNRKRLQQKTDQVQYEIDHGIFEYRLHFPHGTKAHVFDGEGKGQGQLAIKSFAQYATEWLEQSAYALTPATYASYRTIIHTHVVPFFHNLPLGEMTDAHL
jgi:integrase